MNKTAIALTTFAIVAALGFASPVLGYGGFGYGGGYGGGYGFGYHPYFHFFHPHIFIGDPDDGNSIIIIHHYGGYGYGAGGY